jgi:hypothetical protein
MTAKNSVDDVKEDVVISKAGSGRDMTDASGR